MTNAIEEYCDLLEALAELEHEQWAHWINYQHSLRKSMANYVYAQKWKEWLKLAKTPYSLLTEKQRKSDREWARKVLDLIYREEQSLMSQERNKALIFVNHIKRHLAEIFPKEANAKVVCKICHKNIDQIYKEEAQK